nr:hypothetical protein [Pandoravirus belohorizontensis]
MARTGIGFTAGGVDSDAAPLDLCPAIRPRGYGGGLALSALGRVHCSAPVSLCVFSSCRVWARSRRAGGLARRRQNRACLLACFLPDTFSLIFSFCILPLDGGDKEGTHKRVAPVRAGLVIPIERTDDHPSSRYALFFFPGKKRAPNTGRPQRRPTPRANPTAKTKKTSKKRTSR